MLARIKRHSTLWILCGVIIVISILVGSLIFYFVKTDSEEDIVIRDQTLTETIKASPQSTSSATLNSATQTKQYTELVKDSLIDQPIAEDSAQIKDEIQQLNDIQQQLKEQHDLLQQQQQDADQLLQLKQQQLDELEKQLHQSNAKS